MEITRGKIQKAKKVVIYGPEGIGKSTFAARFPGAVFIDTEGSTNDMDVARLPRPTSWNIPKDTDEKVDFDTGAKVEEPVKSTGKKVEDSVFHIADYIPKALRDLMYPNLVSEEELMEAVYQRGFFPKGTPFQNLPQEFVDGCLIGAWPQVLDVIKTMRSHYDIPFDK